MLKREIQMLKELDSFALYTPALGKHNSMIRNLLEILPGVLLKVTIPTLEKSKGKTQVSVSTILGFRTDPCRQALPLKTEC